MIICCTKCLYILLEFWLYFPKKFFLHADTIWTVFTWNHFYFGKKELLSLFRIYRKNTTSAQMDGQITKDGPLYAGTLHLISLVFSWIGFEFLTKFGSKVWLTDSKNELKAIIFTDSLYLLQNKCQLVVLNGQPSRW